MNIFLDTTLLISDPFLKGKYTKRLLDLVEKLDGVIFISELVLQEARKNYIEQFESALRRLKKQHKEAKRFFFEDYQFDPNSILDEHIQLFNKFYDELISREKIEIIEIDNDLLPEVIKRSIYKIKPFSDGKQEFKDCIIWLSYSSFINENGLNNCFFITNNISDFYNEDQTHLHPDLLKDTDKIKPYRFPSQLLKFEPLFSENEALMEWLEEENINEEYTRIILETQLFNDLFEHLSSLFSYMNYSEISDLSIYSNNDYGMGADSLEMYDLNIQDVYGLETKLLDGELIISGIVDLVTSVELECFNPIWEQGDPETLNLGSTEVEVELNFSFIYNTNKEAIDLEILDYTINGNYFFNTGVY